MCIINSLNVYACRGGVFSNGSRNSQGGPHDSKTFDHTWWPCFILTSFNMSRGPLAAAPPPEIHHWVFDCLTVCMSGYILFVSFEFCPVESVKAFLAKFRITEV